MSNNKTVIEWLEQAKADGYPWADAAKENCKKHPLLPNSSYSRISDAILNGFNWSSTKEGDVFWDNVHDSISTRQNERNQNQ